MIQYIRNINTEYTYFNYEQDAVIYEHDQAFSSYSISHYQGLKGIIKIDTISRL